MLITEMDKRRSIEWLEKKADSGSDGWRLAAVALSMMDKSLPPVPQHRGKPTTFDEIRRIVTDLEDSLADLSAELDNAENG